MKLLVKNSLRQLIKWLTIVTLILTLIVVAPRMYECSITRLMNTTYHGEIEKLQQYTRQGVVEKGRGSEGRGSEERGREGR